MTTAVIYQIAPIFLGRRGVPQIFIRDTHIGGCDDLRAMDRTGELDELLEA